MTGVERLAELREHLDHLERLRESRRPDPKSLRNDISLRNDVFQSLLVVCQAVIDVSGEIAGRHGLSFHDYTEAVLRLSAVRGFSTALVEELAELPGFRDVLIHEYVSVDYERVIAALQQLDRVKEFARLAAEELSRLTTAAEDPDLP